MKNSQPDVVVVTSPRFRFTIEGGVNYDDTGRIWDDKKRNPSPKLKMTGKQKWMPKAQAYQQWKELVVRTFLKSIPSEEVRAFFEDRIRKGLKPIPGVPKERMEMRIVAHYKNHKHPDTENVFGSIADALFQNDTNLSGSFDFTVGQEHLQYHTHVELRVPSSIFDVCHTH